MGKIRKEEATKGNTKKNKKTEGKKYNVFYYFKAVIILLFVFTALFLIIFRYVDMINKNYDINMMTNKLNDIRAENSYLSAKLDKQLNITKINDFATNRLNMAKPSKDQIVYIDLDIEDKYIANEVEDVRSKYLRVLDIIQNTFDSIKIMFQDFKIF